jgi:NADH-quinone oxidoreductase subunit G
MPTLTINDQSITVADGTTIIQAADRLGIEIPRYCYHPGLSVAGSCRMCLVEVEKMPKLQPACNTRAAEGMIVRTNSEKVRQAVAGVLEFLLINHPLDCPVCDQAGECFLQEYYMKFGLYDSRFNENKTKRKKAQPIGEYVMLDNERCILCARCVRFVREVTGSNELAIFNRGAESEIQLLPGQTLDNAYSANVVDICPVGALTDRDFRFQCRVWYLKRTASICPGCSRGCNIEIHSNPNRPHHADGRRVIRLKPRFNPEVNQWWICDEGRYGFGAVDAPSRIVAAAERRESWVEISVEEGVQRAAGMIRQAVELQGQEAVYVLASPQQTNEELYLVRKLFHEKLQLEHLDFRVPDRRPASEDQFLIRADKNPNSKGAEIILPPPGTGFEQWLSFTAAGSLLLVFEHDLVAKLGEEKAGLFLSRFDRVIYAGTNHNATSSRAHLILPVAVHAEIEGTFTNFEGRVQRIQQAIPPLEGVPPGHELLIQLGKAMEYPEASKSPSAVFDELAGSQPAFAGMSYQTLGNSGQKLHSVEP